MIKLNRLIDRIQQWRRFPQPNWLQRSLLGLKTDSFDLDFVARQQAAESSAQYLIKNMRQAKNFDTDYDLHFWLKSQLNIPGHILEFGVATGRSIKHWAACWPHRTIQGFDSFNGLPETWHWRIRQGHFAQHIPQVPKNVRLHVGLFDFTLPKWLKENPGNIAFLHIDSDLYSSAAYVLESLNDRLQAGTIIKFDEYFNFPGWEQDEFRAWQEHVVKYGIEYEYLGFVSSHQEVALRITKKHF